MGTLMFAFIFYSIFKFLSVLHIMVCSKQKWAGVRVSAVARVVPVAFVSLCVWVAEAFAKSDGVFWKAWAHVVCSIPAWHQQLRSSSSAEHHVGSHAGNSTCGIRILRLRISGRGVYPPWCIDVAMANYVGVAMHTGLFFCCSRRSKIHTFNRWMVVNLVVAIFSGMMCAFQGAVAWSLRLCATRIFLRFRFIPGSGVASHKSAARSSELLF